MADSPSGNALQTARASLSHPLSFADFLAKLSPKDRASAERRVTVLQAAPDPAGTQLWQRLACSLMTLAPLAAKLVGKQTLQLYIPDGKYRMQVFALEDLQDGTFTVYCPDVLDEAMQAGLLARDPSGDADKYLIPATNEVLLMKQLDKSTLNPAAHYKDMMGWNRKALRITLPPSASATQIETAEVLCALGAQHFARPAT